MSSENYSHFLWPQGVNRSCQMIKGPSPQNGLTKHCLTQWIPNTYAQAICYYAGEVQYIPRNMHTVTALLCFVVVIHWLIFPYPSGLLHWHCGNLTIAPVPAKQPWWIWINTSCEFIMNDCITTTKQSTTKPCAYFLGYTVFTLISRDLRSNTGCFATNSPNGRLANDQSFSLPTKSMSDIICIDSARPVQSSIIIALQFVLEFLRQ